MLKGIFSPDNPVFRFFIKLGYCWWLNILWLVTSIPIITIGASTTALIYSAMKLQNDEGHPTGNFFRSFKENFRQSTIIWLIYMVAGALLALAAVYWNQVPDAGGFIFHGAAFALILLYVISFSYVFAIQSKFVNSVKDTIHYSFILPFRNLKETILILITLGAVVYLNVTTIFMVNFWTMNLGIGLMAYLFGVFYANVFKRYIPEDDEEEEEEGTFG